MKRFVAILALVFPLSVVTATSVAANNAALSINCEDVTATLTQFPPGTHTITFTGQVDGTSFTLTAEATVGEDGTGIAHVNIVDLTGAGDSAVNPQPVTVSASASWIVAGGGETDTVAFTDTCAIPEETPPGPPETPVPPTPEVPPVVPAELPHTA